MRGFPIDVSPEVEALHRDAFVFDLHNDLLTKLTHFPHDISKRNGTATFWNPLRLDLDLPRMSCSHCAKGFFSSAGVRMDGPVLAGMGAVGTRSDSTASRDERRL